MSGTVTSTGTGITLTNNTGSTITLSGSLTINTGANEAFTATGGGTINVTGAINTVTTTTSTAVNIANTTIGASGVTFRSLSSNGGAAPGLILNNTGSAGNFTVSGTGSAGTGGTIQNKTGNAIQLTTVDGVSLNFMNLTGIANNGILGTTVTDFTMTGSNLTNIADTLSPDEAAVFFTDLQGISTFNNNTITNAFDDQIIVFQTGTTNLTSFTLTGNTFNGHDNDNDAFRYQGFNTTNATIAFTGNTFVNSDGDFIQITLENSANLNLTVGGPLPADANSFTHPGGFTILGGGITLSPGGGPGWNGRFDFDINGNTISGSNAQAIIMNLLQPANSAIVDGFIRNNTISNANNNFGGTIQVVNGGSNSQVTVEISGNSITGDNGVGGIYVIGDQGNTVMTNARTDLRVLNNTISAPRAFNTNAFHLNSSTTSGNSGGIVCLDMQNNTLAGGGFSGTDTRIRQRFSSQVWLPGYGGGSADTAAVQTYISGRGNTGVISAATQTPGGYFSGTCNAPTVAQISTAEIIAALQAAEQQELLTLTPADTAAKDDTTALANSKSISGLTVSKLINNSNPSLSAKTAVNTPLLAPEATTTIGPFTLPSGESTTITFRVVVNDPFLAANNPICNQATISGSNFSDVLSDDPDVAGSSDPTCTAININADLAITKTNGVTTAVPGTAVTYTIVVSNAGPYPDPSAVIIDNFPAAIIGLTWTCAGAGGATCTAAGSGNLNETVNLPVDGSVTFTATGTISPAATGSLANTATAATSTGITDPIPGNNSATDTDTLTPQAEVSITKTDEQTSAVPGTSIVYTITASNAGPSDAPSVTIADTFPASLTGISWTCVGADSGVCTASGTGDINDTANLPAGGSVTYTVNATIAASAAGTLTNTATATLADSVTDPDTSNNSATDTTTLAPEADVSITKTDGQTSAVPGTSIVYTITASNAGPSDAPSVTIADTFPASLTGVSWTCAGAGGAACAVSGSGDIDDTANLPAGGSVTYTVNATIDASAAGELSNTATATVGGGLTDPNPANNSATDTTTLMAEADLAITKTDGQATSVPGQPITYTIVASNAGPSDDASAVVADTFPAAITGITWTCVGAGGGSCTATGSGNINETVNLPVGGSVTFTASGTISESATGTLANTATVTSSVTDPTPGNNSATDTNTLTPTADLAITKSDGQATALPGQPITYTIVASNAGPSDAPGTGVADTFPAALTGVTWTCVGAGGATCTAAGTGNIAETVNLPAGGSVTFSASGTLDAGATGTLVNTADVTAPGGVTDPDTDNNSATDTNTLIPTADLSLTKTDGLGAAIPGQSTTYTITVSNAGPSTAVNATVADTFSVDLTGITWTCTSAGGASCTAAGSGDIADTVTLPPGSSLTYVIDATIDAGASSSTLVNTATITAPGGMTDPDTNNNSSTDSTNLDAPPEITALIVTPGMINENDTVNLSVTFTDPNTLETHEVVIDWGDGISETINLPLGTLTTSADHTYLDDNPTGTPSDDYTITVTINETDGGTDSDTAVVTVNNVAPTLSGLSATDVSEGSATTLSGIITDPGTQDTFTLLVDWGDGSSETFNYGAGTAVFTETHTYADDDPTGTPADVYTVALTLTDDDTGSANSTTTLTVHNLAPLVDAGVNRSVAVGTTVTFNGSFTDAGTLDTHTIDWDFGDGGTASGTLTPSHTFTAEGVYTVTLTVTDDDTGVGSDSLIVTVTDGSTQVYVYLPIVMVSSSTPPGPDLVVSSLVASGSSITVVVTNQGDTAVTDAFWVDAYIDPDPIPTRVNQTWLILAEQGLVWGVDNVTINPGQSLTLAINGDHYRASLSNFSGNLLSGTPVYAQVDSANATTTYGGVLENHENSGGVYNNITGTTAQ